MDGTIGQGVDMARGKCCNGSLREAAWLHSVTKCPVCRHETAKVAFHYLIIEADIPALDERKDGDDDEAYRSGDRGTWCPADRRGPGVRPGWPRWSRWRSRRWSWWPRSALRADVRGSRSQACRRAGFRRNQAEDYRRAAPRVGQVRHRREEQRQRAGEAVRRSGQGEDA